MPLNPRIQQRPHRGQSGLLQGPQLHASPPLLKTLPTATSSLRVALGHHSLATPWSLLPVAASEATLPPHSEPTSWLVAGPEWLPSGPSFGQCHPSSQQPQGRLPWPGSWLVCPPQVPQPQQGCFRPLWGSWGPKRSGACAMGEDMGCHPPGHPPSAPPGYCARRSRGELWVCFLGPPQVGRPRRGWCVMASLS